MGEFRQTLPHGAYREARTRHPDDRKAVKLAAVERNCSGSGIMHEAFREHLDLEDQERSYSSMTQVTLAKAFPKLAAELADLLRLGGRSKLAEQVASLPIVNRCRCGDDFRATFYTAKVPRGAYGPKHRCLPRDPKKGMIVLDLVRSEIKCVEVLYQPEIRASVLKMCP